MFDAIESGDKKSSSYRRRVYPRKNMPLGRDYFYIDLGHCDVGKILNISEGGLSVQAITNSIDESLPYIRFNFAQSEVWVETGGRIAWANESRDVAGIEFINLSAEGRDQIRDWLDKINVRQPVVTSQQPIQPCQVTISADSFESLAFQNTAGELPPIELEDLAPPSVAFASHDAGWKRDQVRGLRSSPVLTTILLILFATDLSLFFLARDLHHKRVGEQEFHEKTVAAAQSPQSPISKRDSVKTEHPLLGIVPSDQVASLKQTPGFVLQTGAMVRVENASELADSLRRRNFPIFVIKSGSDNLYRVYVGPYRDRQSAVATDTELSRQGFTAILKRWSSSNNTDYRTAIAPH